MLFHHRRLSLGRIDPLGDGLREMIQAEQAEPDAMTLDDQTDGTTLTEEWAKIDEELEKDPDWFTFAED